MDKVPREGPAGMKLVGASFMGIGMGGGGKALECRDNATQSEGSKWQIGVRMHCVSC